MDLLSFKPDWPRARERLTAFWERSAVDRPCIAVKAPQAARRSPPPEPDALQALWLDPDYLAARWLWQLESTYFGGEAVPTGDILLAGYATGCGPGVRFAPNTIWHPQTMASMDAPLGWHPGPQDPWRPKLAAVLERLLDLAAGRFLVGYTIQVPPNDLLALLRGSQGFLLDMAMDLDKCRARLDEILPLYCENFDYFRRILDARQQGCVWSWPGLWSEHFVMISQSDMSCMISGEMFERYVLRDMDLLAERYGRIWYHLDGPGAIRHLPRLLSRPYICAIQFVPGDGQPPNGPAYIDLYRRVQAEGRCLDLDAPPGHMEYLVRHLRPEGLLLRTEAATPEAADQLLEDAVRWCGSDAGPRPSSRST